MHVIVVDAANVMGARPDGWWRDRAGAASRLHGRLAAAALPADEVVLVVEGAAKAGPPPGESDGVRVVHASRSGDDAIVTAVTAARGRGADEVVVVTADRGLRTRVEEAGGSSVGPGWLLERIGSA